ncbi:MAG: ATP synthase subunit I [bacterium]|nr:ATP synthase subunit I [bacterium]MCM1375295.1 ATP synthase subunit I [Muribaculum sp.]MCM1409788.1 ATP synthase subunit I [Lachnospiraceae bacterium]
MTNRLREMNRALLELDVGIIFCGVICQLAGVWFVSHKALYTVSLWMGVALALLGSWHMYRTLDRALDLGDGASKVVVAGTLLRYGILAIVLGIVAITDILNPLVVFLGYMTMKVAAYIQPFTHKVCNMFFHETDPIPEPMPDEETAEASNALE